MKAGDLYPWTLHKAGKRTKVVQNDDERRAAMADGWEVTPPDQVAHLARPEPDPEPEPEPEVEAPRKRRR